jgi:phosphoribosylglycinamide formyltransferase 1
LKNRRWALFLSGRGSTAQAVMDVQSQVDLRLVISSRRQAAGLSRARRNGLPTLILPQKINWQAVQAELSARRIGFIFLLGFMRILPEDFCRRWRGRIFNVHPSLLPAFPGLQAMEKSHAAKQAMGVTVHVVTPGMDEGPAIFQKTVLEENHQIDFQEARIRMSFKEQELVRRMALNVERVTHE